MFYVAEETFHSSFHPFKQNKWWNETKLRYQLIKPHAPHLVFCYVYTLHFHLLNSFSTISAIMHPYIVRYTLKSSLFVNKRFLEKQRQQIWESSRRTDYHLRTTRPMMTNWEWSLWVDGVYEKWEGRVGRGGMGSTDMLREQVREDKRWWMRVRNMLWSKDGWTETERRRASSRVE